METYKRLEPDSAEELRVSVCIPVYNAAATIEKCIESVLNQTIKPNEILVVDGGSEDETLKILERYPNVKIIGSAKGIGRARKLLATHAKGDIIAWVDADVVVPPNWLETHLKIHSENKEVMILSGRWQTFGAVSRGESIPPISCEVQALHEWLGVTQAACTMKRALFSKASYDERFRRGEEWDLMVSAHRKGIRSHYCDGLVVFHTRRPTKKYLRDTIYAGNYVLFLKKYGLWYIKFNPKHLLAFIFRMALIYAIPVSFVFPPALLIYPVAWVAYAIYGKVGLFSASNALKLPAELMKAIGEHLYLFNIL